MRKSQRMQHRTGHTSRKDKCGLAESPRACLGLAAGMGAKSHQPSFWGDGNILELHGRGAGTPGQMYGGSLDTHVTWVSSAACQWCLSKAVVWMELHTMVLTDTNQTRPILHDSSHRSLQGHIRKAERWVPRAGEGVRRWCFRGTRLPI